MTKSILEKVNELVIKVEALEGRKKNVESMVYQSSSTSLESFKEDVLTKLEELKNK